MRFFVVLSTTPDRKSARKIARILVQKRLAGCVSFGGGWESTYRWKGKIEVSSEVLLLIKTSASKLKALQKVLPEIHPYEVPEILALPVSGGFKGYLEWLQNTLK